jgi:hypothetical protein
MIQPTENTTQHLLPAAIDRALNFLNRDQLPTGRFPVYCTLDIPPKPTDFPDESPFLTTHIVYSLCYSRSEKAKNMIHRALRFFQQDMEWPGTWRHWIKGHKFHWFSPPDLDDIACISYLLRKYGVKFPDNKPLILLCRNREGLFYTWLIPRLIPTLNWVYWWTTLNDLNANRIYFFWKKTWARRPDIDSVVNANVLLYLGQSKETAAVIDYLIQVVREGKEASTDKWYQNQIPLYYAISRNYDAGVKALGAIRDETISRLESSAEPNGCIAGNVLSTAIACCTFLNFGCHSAALHAGLNYLLSAQNPDGSWESVRFYYGGPRRHWGWGSSALTTGFCVEALERYGQLQK